MDRVWWNDANKKEELSLRAASGRWYIISTDRNDVVLPGQVIKIVFAGYKIRNCRGVESIVSPEKVRIVDVILTAGEDIAQHEEYQRAVEQFEAQEAIKQQIIDDRIREEQAKLDFQRQCQHSDDSSGLSEEISGGAGCDIHEYSCTTCHKFLRRSYSTAYDRDPDDEIGDWDWWVRYYRKQYNQEPKREDYRIL